MIHVTHLLNQYGYIVLLISLTLELIAFPLPGEILMTYCGFLIYQGHLHYIFSIIFTLLGVMIGITFSYLIGKKLGRPFFEKYGRKVHLGPDQLDKTTKWFDKYGSWLLIIAYFIPGVRHVTGYVSGLNNLPFKKFASKAYLGAAIWVFTFITLGSVLGNSWKHFHRYILKFSIIGGVIIVIVGLIIYLVKRRADKVKAR